MKGGQTVNEAKQRENFRSMLVISYGTNVEWAQRQGNKKERSKGATAKQGTGEAKPKWPAKFWGGDFGHKREEMQGGVGACERESGTKTNPFGGKKEGGKKVQTYQREGKKSKITGETKVGQRGQLSKKVSVN